jgi:precorrin-2 dehydrogenase/sirohydrochlorin ferrochelatase
MTMTRPDTSTLNGGSLLLAWQLKNKRVLIVGGGDVAASRLESVLVADALITLISPQHGLHKLTKHLIDELTDRITYHDRVFAGAEDLVNVDMVLTAIDDVKLSLEIGTMCRQLRIPVNVADIPTSCDFYFGSQIRDGPLQIMISTNGNSPKLANLIRRKIEESLPEYARGAIEKVGELRRLLKERAPGVGGGIGKRRMKWMVDVCTSWELADLASLNDETIKKMLDDGWDKDCVPSLEDVGGKRRKSSMELSRAMDLALPVTLGFIAGFALTTLAFITRRS